MSPERKTFLRLKAKGRAIAAHGTNQWEVAVRRFMYALYAGKERSVANDGGAVQEETMWVEADRRVEDAMSKTRNAFNSYARRQLRGWFAARGLPPNVPKDDIEYERCHDKYLYRGRELEDEFFTMESNEPRSIERFGATTAAIRQLVEDGEFERTEFKMAIAACAIQHITYQRGESDRMALVYARISDPTVEDLLEHRRWALQSEMLDSFVKQMPNC